jgi:hypothetical protein
MTVAPGSPFSLVFVLSQYDNYSNPALLFNLKRKNTSFAAVAMLVSRVRYFVLLVHLCDPCHAYESGNVVPEKDENKKFHEWHRNLACDKIYIDKCLFAENH